MDRSVILGTAGHIDHGKNALVRALTGVDTDRLPEEKRRGITIDLGFAPLEIDGIGTIGIVDVPGHEGFIRTMLAGASGIDLALFVVAADEGVMPQTREHLEILSLLEIPAGVIALTKCDLVDAEWQSLVAEDVRSLCAGTMLHDAEMISVSSMSGQNVNTLRDAIARAASRVTTDRAEDLFRMPIDRAFTIKGAGTVVTGTVWSGSVSGDTALRILPVGKSARVRTVQSHGKTIDTAFPGTRVAVGLAGSDLKDVERGSTLVATEAWTPTREIDARLKVTADDFHPTPRTRVRLHIGTSETGARLSRLRASGNGVLHTRLVLDEPVVARGRDRFVIRLPSPARTVGGGEVIDPYPPRRKPPPGLDGNESANLDERLQSMLSSAGSAGLSIDNLPIRTGYSVAEVSKSLERVGATLVGDRAFAPATIRQMEQSITRFVSLGMANHPLEAGVSLQTVRSTVRAPGQVVELILDRLCSSRVLERDGSVVRPEGWISRLNEREQALSDAILHAICIQPFEPPSVGELKVKFGGSTLPLVRRLERQGELERVSEDRYYSTGALESMVGTLRSSLKAGRQYSPSELREIVGVSRKYLIPFLEFCDRRGVTERSESGRVLRPDIA